MLVALTSSCAQVPDEPSRTKLAVFAASSLTEAFRDLEAAFEAVHPDVDVELTFAGSQVLRLQIEQGATADVFASANESHLRALVRSEYIVDARVFARNELVVIVPPDNPAGIEAFSGLDRASRIVIGTESVPVGMYTRELLDRAGLELGEEFVASVRQHIASEESNVRLVRAKVEMGEADAAIVYRTDAVASDRVRVISIPSALQVRAAYSVGASVHSARSSEAEGFIAFLRSEAAGEILRRRGFEVEAE